MAGTAVAHAGGEALARDVADHLRALLRDVICGHLDPDLVALADEILHEQDRLAAEFQPPDADAMPIAAHATAAPVRAMAAHELAEEMFGDTGEPEEVLDVFI